MSLEEIEYLDQKSAKERAKYRTALSVKDFAALIFFDGDARGFEDAIMKNIAFREYSFFWLLPEVKILEGDHKDGYNTIFVFLNQKTGGIAYETKVSGLIVKQKLKIKVDLARIEININEQVSFKEKLYEEELNQLITEELLRTAKDISPPPTKDDIARRKKWNEANRFINVFLKEVLIKHKISYEPKKDIIEGHGMRPSVINYYIEFIADQINARKWGAECDVNKTSDYCKKHNIGHGDPNGFVYIASAQNIEIEKAILVKYVNSKVGAWLRDIIKATLLAEWLNLDEIADFQSINPGNPEIDADQEQNGESTSRKSNNMTKDLQDKIRINTKDIVLKSFRGYKIETIDTIPKNLEDGIVYMTKHGAYSFLAKTTGEKVERKLSIDPKKNIQNQEFLKAISDLHKNEGLLSSKFLSIKEIEDKLKKLAKQTPGLMDSNRGTPMKIFAKYYRDSIYAGINEALKTLNLNMQFMSKKNFKLLGSAQKVKEGLVYFPNSAGTKIQVKYKINGKLQNKSLKGYSLNSLTVKKAFEMHGLIFNKSI